MPPSASLAIRTSPARGPGDHCHRMRGPTSSSPLSPPPPVDSIPGDFRERQNTRSGCKIGTEEGGGFRSRTTLVYGMDGGSRWPRRASSASSAPRPSESGILLSTRRVRQWQARRARERTHQLVAAAMVLLACGWKRHWQFSVDTQVRRIAKLAFEWGPRR